ncbi:MAG: DUF1579 domain-containing protein [Chitinophagaceae bacterium]|nr:DUF1579 domain-containing protein [Chitinophagaceae bacterium]
MKHKILSLFAAVVILFSCNSETKDTKTEGGDTNTTASSDKKEEPWVSVDSATMMKNMMEYGTPGPMHEMLASWSGTWNGESTIWEYEGATPQKSTGTAVSNMIMGGKYQSSTHSGNMMGMPFEGMSIMGYDNAAKQFTSTWVDNWSTGIMAMAGQWDAASKTLTMTGKMPDINRPGKECSYKEVFKVIDDNNQVMEMYGPDPKTGKEFKMMEMKMTRKK